MGWENPPHIFIKPGEAMNKSGVYCIRNKINGHRYIGSSCNIIQRWKKHQWELNNGTHCNKHLQGAWFKYGGENFEFCILLECRTDELIENEQRHIDKTIPEYNMVPFARIGKGNKGRKRPDNIARNKTFRSKGHTGCLHSDETKAKMSAAWVERKKIGFSDETRVRMSAASKGRIHSPEARAKISAALMGHSVSAEAREKSAAAQRGRKLSPERIQLSIAGTKLARQKRECQK